MKNKSFRSLPTDSIVNIRDLGGYPTKDGGITKYGLFVRSASPSKASPEDIDFLSQYGITLSMDFRHHSLVDKYPLPFINDSRFEYIHIPVYLRVNRNSEFNSEFSWEKEYPQSVDVNKEWIKTVMQCITQNSGGCIFNCSAGKDRTGIIAAILLLIAGVSRDDIISDYSVSEIYVSRNIDSLLESMPTAVFENGIPNLSNPFFSSSYKNMETLLEHLFNKYGTIDDYLDYCGVPSEQVQLIRKRFVRY